MESSEESGPKSEKSIKTKFQKWGEAVFLTGVAGASIVFGFGSTLASAKKKDPEYFGKGMALSGPRVEPGGMLAMRALGWGTVYAVTGCSILFYAVWKMLGVKDLQEFRLKMGNILPTIPKNSPPQGRTEFENLTDLLQYIIDEDNRLKIEKSNLKEPETKSNTTSLE